MVEVIITNGAVHTGSSQGGGNPLIHVYAVQRDVHGSGVWGTVYGSMKIAAGERVWASELKLNSIETLILTPEIPINNVHGYMAQQYTYQKGAYENYASIDIYTDAATWCNAGANGLTDGSIWLSFIAHGEI
jgi:hypothetical protein